MGDQESASLVKLTVHGVLPDPNTDTQIVILRDEQNAEILPIWVGAAEGRAIEVALKGDTPPRPMTHDLIKSLTDHFRTKVSRVVVTDVKSSTYYATIHLAVGDTERTVDSRPSDAIALALRANSPIYVTHDVLKRRGGSSLEDWLEKLNAKDSGKSQV